MRSGQLIETTDPISLQNIHAVAYGESQDTRAWVGTNSLYLIHSTHQKVPFKLSTAVLFPRRLPATDPRTNRTQGSAKRFGKQKQGTGGSCSSSQRVLEACRKSFLGNECLERDFWRSSNNMTVFAQVTAMLLEASVPSLNQDSRGCPASTPADMRWALPRIDTQPLVEKPLARV